MKEVLFNYIYLIQSTFWVTLILQWRAAKVFNHRFNYVPLLKLNFLATTAAGIVSFALGKLGVGHDGANGFGFLAWYFSLKALMELAFLRLPIEVTGRKIATVITTTLLAAVLGCLVLAGLIGALT